MRTNRYSIGLIVIICFVVSFPVVRKNLSRHVWDNTLAFMRVLNNSGSSVKGYFSFVGEIASLRQKNDRLAAKIVELEVDKSKISELEHENSLLKKELGFFEADTTEELVPARIVGREPVSFLDYIIVDRGRDNGLERGMAVISGGVLVGQVSDVYEKTARITLITSKDSVIQAMLQNSRSKGVLKGGISGLVLENVTQDIDYAKGEDVVTSGLGGELKEGILIGKASDLRSPSSGIFKDIAVDPSADLSKLEVVFIVKR